jgi:hypothetical protein
LHRISR